MKDPRFSYPEYGKLIDSAEPDCGNRGQPAEAGFLTYELQILWALYQNDDDIPSVGDWIDWTRDDITVQGTVATINEDGDMTLSDGSITFLGPVPLQSMNGCM